MKDQRQNKKPKRFSQRKESWMRLIIGIISGVILVAWRYLITLFAIINFFYSIFSGKRLKELATLSEIWNTNWYHFQRYMIFMTNSRPFPFTPLAKDISKYE